MIRTLWLLLCACCVLVVLAEFVGAGFLWSQGILSANRLREIRELLGPQEKEPVAKGDETRLTLPSSQEVVRERSLRVLSLSSLQTEVALLKSMVERERTGLTEQNALFQQQKNAFKTQLLQLADENTLAAREQARTVLQALPAPEAVERLMQLSADEDVLLMREMPEAKIAALLKEFAPAPDAPGDAATNASKTAQERGRRAKEIFEQITRGEPRDSVIRSALNSVRQAEGSGEPPPLATPKESSGKY